MTASLFAGYFSVFSTRIGYVLPRKLLPVESCMRLNKDTLIFIAGSTSKFYSQSKKRILNTIEDSQRWQLVRTSAPLYETNGELYYSATYPSV